MWGVEGGEWFKQKTIKLCDAIYEWPLINILLLLFCITYVDIF